jgi:FMN phosphatase YigB (HAD superfamily)
MIGDSPEHDIAGAHALGLGTVWIGAGDWPADELGFRPSHITADISSAIRHVLAADAR